MKFTQYRFPRGEKVPVTIEVPADIEAKAEELEKAGWRFEIECAPETQIVHMDCCNFDRALANRLVRNGPGVPPKVAELVNEAHSTWLSQGKPQK